jgi:hypothetical protein
LATSTLADTSVVLYEGLLEEQKLLTETKTRELMVADSAVVDEAWGLNAWCDVLCTYKVACWVT